MTYRLHESEKKFKGLAWSKSQASIMSFWNKWVQEAIARCIGLNCLFDLFVRRAKDLRDGSDVAVKVLRILPGQDLEPMHREAKFFKDEDPSSYLVLYQGSFLHQQTVWIVMEFCGGGSVEVSFVLSNIAH